MIIFLNFFRRLGRQLVRSNILPIVSLTASLILIGTVAFARLEGWGWLDALYTTMITMTTVGYGDLSPQEAFLSPPAADLTLQVDDILIALPPPKME